MLICLYTTFDYTNEQMDDIDDILSKRIEEAGYPLDDIDFGDAEPEGEYHIVDCTIIFVQDESPYDFAEDPFVFIGRLILEILGLVDVRVYEDDGVRYISRFPLWRHFH